MVSKHEALSLWLNSAIFRTDESIILPVVCVYFRRLCECDNNNDLERDTGVAEMEQQEDCVKIDTVVVLQAQCRIGAIILILDLVPTQGL